MVSHQTTLAAATLLEIGSRPQFNPGSLALVGAITGFLRRKHPIGGWLFYILFQLFLGLAAMAINLNWAQFAPRNWTNPKLYLIFTLTTLPQVLALTTVCPRVSWCCAPSNGSGWWCCAIS
jgi:predicted membrane channel-forming protein YqfA (hemolysin III family)